MVLDMDANERELKKITQKMKELKDQKDYLVYEKRKIEEEAIEVNSQRLSLEAKVEQLRQRRQEMIFLKDKTNKILTSKIAIK